MDQPLLHGDINNWQLRDQISKELPQDGDANIGHQGFVDLVLHATLQANSIAATIRSNKDEIRKLKEHIKLLADQAKTICAQLISKRERKKNQHQSNNNNNDLKSDNREIKFLEKNQTNNLKQQQSLKSKIKEVELTLPFKDSSTASSFQGAG